MKFNEEMMEMRTRKMCEDPFWAEIYEHAPEGAKKRLRVAFWASRALNEREDLDAYRSYREQLESEMTYEDFAYLAAKFPEGAGKEHYKKMCGDIQFRSLKTGEKLDEAMAIMMEGCTGGEREAIEKSRDAFKACDDPCVDYEWLWLAVGGNGDSCCMVGDIFDHGHGVERDEALAFFWFRKGALSGDGDCCYRLAHLYEDAEGPRFDMARTMFWFREGLRRQNQLCKVELGARLTVRDGDAWLKRRNPKLGVSLLESSLMDDKDGVAHYYLAECHEKGCGVQKSVKEALRLYRISDRRGCGCAREALERLGDK